MANMALMVDGEVEAMENRKLRGLSTAATLRALAARSQVSCVRSSASAALFRRRRRKRVSAERCWAKLDSRLRWSAMGSRRSIPWL
jgi:hypothetical protein